MGSQGVLFQSGGDPRYGGRMGCKLIAIAGSDDSPLPMMESRVRAGFPSPAEDYLQKNINLQELLVQHPQATFLMQVEGDSMKECGIQDGDIIVVDRALTPAHGKVIVAQLNAEFTIKRLAYRKGRCFLEAANAAFPAIEISEDVENRVWGVVTHVIHKVK